MRRILPAAGLTLAALALTGCMQSATTAENPDEDITASEATQSAETAPAEESADSSEGEVSERGNTEASVGDTATISSTDDPDSPVMTFTVSDIEVDPTCTGDYPQDPENGHFMTVDIDAQTGNAEQFEELLMGQDLHISSGSFQFISSDGVTANTVTSGAAFGCLPQSDYLPSDIGPSETVSGTVVLDVPDTEGILVLKEPMTQLSWEWDVPSA